MDFTVFTVRLFFIFAPSFGLRDLPEGLQRKRSKVIIE
jgi:hypothetical protein